VNFVQCEEHVFIMFNYKLNVQVVVLNTPIQEYRILSASVLWGWELGFRAGVTIFEMTCGTQGQLDCMGASLQ
jgi:hypothetical protein